MTEAKSSVGHFPNGEKWAFDDRVTEVFDDMLRRSIPAYDWMRRAVYEASIAAMGAQAYGAARIGTVVDLGASRGEAIAPLITGYPGASFVAVETAPAMLEVLRHRFADRVSVFDYDLRRGLPPIVMKQTNVPLVLSVLTLQFVPVEYRARIVADVRTILARRGGAFVLVEKVLGGAVASQTMMVDAYHAMKVEHGYSSEEVEAKRLSLEGVLVPQTASQNERMLYDAGFDEVECIWRWMNFVAWVAFVRP